MSDQLSATVVKPKIVAVVGATGAGKTEFAIRLAKKFNAEIICADSIQIYKKLNIGSAKPSAAQLKAVKHHLVDLLDLDQTYNSAIFAKLAEKSITDIIKNNKLPVICGSAMLYIKNLVYGIADIPEIPSHIRQLVNQTWVDKGGDYCLAWLKKLTPSLEFKFKDAQRVKRALEVALYTGKSIVNYQSAHMFSKQAFECLFIEVSLPREKLYATIEKRVDGMLSRGLVEEVSNLLKAGIQPNIKPLQSIGYKQTVSYLLGELSYAEMKNQIKTKTKNYAKRQLTWYKKQPGIKRFSNFASDAQKAVSEFLN